MGVAMADVDPFTDFSDLSEDDFRIINQVTQHMGLSTIDDDTNSKEVDEVKKLREELARTKQRAEELERTMNQLQQERYTKEGEVAILRDKLSTLERERIDSAMKATQKIQQSEQERMALEEEYRKSTETLKTQLKFKDQELELITSQIDNLHIGNKENSRKERRLDPVIEEPEGFESLKTNKRPLPKEIPVVQIAETPKRIEEPEPELLPIFHFKTARQLIDQAIECVDSVRDITKLASYDYEAILKQRAKMQKIASETDDVLAAVEIAYDTALEWQRVALKFIPLVLFYLL